MSFNFDSLVLHSRASRYIDLTLVNTFVISALLFISVYFVKRGFVKVHMILQISLSLLIIALLVNLENLYCKRSVAKSARRDRSSRHRLSLFIYSYRVRYALFILLGLSFEFRT